MNTYRILLVLLTLSCMFVYGCKKHQPVARDSEFPMYHGTVEVSKDPNAYYDGCVSCILTIEKEGFWVKHILVRATFKNETDYPIPIEKRNLFISIDGRLGRMDYSTFEVLKNGKEVEYRGQVIKRPTDAAKFPEDYYILPPRGECITIVDLSKYYNLRRGGKYLIKYRAWNYLSSLVNMSYALKIESDEVYFDKD